MSFEKFVYRNQLMLQCLENIAASNGVSGLFQYSSDLRPQVRELLAAQERLLTAAERVLERCQPTEQVH